MKESEKWQRCKSNNTTKEGDIHWHSKTQKKSNKDDAKENSFKEITVPHHVSLKFDRTKTFSFSSTVDMEWGLRSVKYESLSTAFKGMGNWWWYQITAIIVKDHQTWVKPPLCLVHWKPPKLLHCWNCKKLAEEEINAGAQCHEGLRIRGGKFYPYPWTHPLPTLFG